MKLKVTEVGGVKYAALDADGLPVYVHTDGKEVGFNAPSAMAKIGELNGEARTNRLRAEGAEEKLKGFEGIADPAAAIKAMTFAASMEGKKIMDDDGIKAIVTSAIKPFTEQITEKDKLLAEKDEHIFTLEVSNKFASSTFLKNTIYGDTPEAAEAYLGKHFKVEGKKVVAYGSDGKAIYSVKNAGETAGFEEALEKIVMEHPKKDFILKSKVAGGSGADGGTGGGGGGSQKRSTMNDAEKSAYIKKNGLAAYQSLPLK